MPRLLLIDGHYYAFRSFYAIQNLTNPKGEPTNAVFGCVKAFFRMIDQLKPDFATVFFDEGLPKKRMALQPDYKGNRAETPETLVPQFPVIRRILPALGLKGISMEGEEADDLIASYARAGQAEGLEVVVATNDKDLMQLVNEKCFIYRPDQEGFQLLGIPEVTEKWGVPPAQLLELLILMGDNVDNIPGVPGVGPKTAASLIQAHGSVQGILENLPAIKSERIRKLLDENRKILEHNRQMMELCYDLPLSLPIKDLVIRPDYEAQAREFEELGFKSFLREARAKLKPVSAPPAGNVQGELF